MLYFDRINLSIGIDANNTNVSKECDICYYWYFLDKGFKFQLYVCNGCHDVLMMSINLHGNAILNIRCVDYLYNINGIDKKEAINLLQIADLTEKRETLQK